MHATGFGILDAGPIINRRYRYLRTATMPVCATFSFTVVHSNSLVFTDIHSIWKKNYEADSNPFTWFHMNSHRFTWFHITFLKKSSVTLDSIGSGGWGLGSGATVEDGRAKAFTICDLRFTIFLGGAMPHGPPGDKARMEGRAFSPLSGLESFPGALPQAGMGWAFGPRGLAFRAPASGWSSRAVRLR